MNEVKLAPLVPFTGTARFEVLDVLGAGGMGVVYKVRDRQRNATMALKTLLAGSPGHLLRLKHEFRALQDVHHPNLVSLGELFEHENSWFFTMELVHGCDFLSHVRGAAAAPLSLDSLTGSAPPPAGGHHSGPGGATGPGTAPSIAPGTASGCDHSRLRKALAQLASGLAALHARHKVHRDIKPSNVLVTDDSRIVILDFGILAEARSHGPQRAEPLVGTIPFMAPEQIDGTAVGPEADCYAVGVLLYEALTGCLPFTGNSREICAAKLGASPAPPSTLVGDVPPDLDRLCIELLDRNPRARPRATEICERLGYTDPAQAYTPRAEGFFGRRDELTALHRAFDRVRSQREAAALFLCGQSGVGKSALLRVFLDQAAAAGALVLRGRCYQRDEVPYKAVDAVIDELSHHLSLYDETSLARFMPQDAALLAALFPVLRDVCGSAPSLLDPSDAPALRQRAFSALRELLAALARTRALVVAIDDLQWTDADSLALLSGLLRPEDAPPMMLVCAVQSAPPGDLAPRSPSAAAHLASILPCAIEQLTVAGLRDHEARELAEYVAGQDRHPLGIDVAAIVRESEGHPLFIDALLRYSQQPGQRGPVHMSLQEALQARIASVPATARSLLQVVALAGRPLTWQVAAGATGLSIDAVQHLVQFLSGARLVRHAHGQDRVEPYHDRVRDAVCAAMSEDARKRGHGYLALALESAGEQEADLIGLHWRESGQFGRATDGFVQAAARAERALAFDQAARLYELALADCPRPEPALRIKLARALANAGLGERAAQAFLAATDGTSADVALALRQQAAEQLLRCGQIDQGLHMVAELTGPLGIHLPATPRGAMVSLLLQRARLGLRGLHYHARREADVPAPRLFRIDLLWSLGHGLAMVHTVRSADFSTRCLREALDAGEPGRIARALATEAAMLAARHVKYRSRALHMLGDAERAAQGTGAPATLAWVYLNLGLTSMLQGRFREGLEGMQRALPYYAQCTGVHWELVTHDLFALWGRYFVGDLADLPEQCQTRIRAAQATGDLFAQVGFSCGLGTVALLLRDRPEEALRQSATAMSRWSQIGFHIQHYNATWGEGEVLLYQRQFARALRLIEERWPLLRRSLLFEVAVIRTTMRFLRARAAIGTALVTRRPSLLRRAARDASALDGERMRWSSTLAALLRGCIAGVAGHPAASVASFTRAVELAHADGLHLLAAAGRYALARTTPEAAARVNDIVLELAERRVTAPERLLSMLVPGAEGTT